MARLAAVAVLDWLLDSDPAIRWQVLRDLAAAPAEAVAAQRARVATEGWGARLLAVLGVDPSDERVRRAVAQVHEHCRWEHAGQPFFSGEVEPCINGRTVGIGVYFGQKMDGLVARMLGEQLEDGGWNCYAEYGSVRSSFHTTICVLEGLLAYECATGGSSELTSARRRGEEYLLVRNLFRGQRSGDVVDPAWLRFSFPTRWHYDVLRGLEYFRATGDPPDKRVDEAVRVLRDKRLPDGTWPLENTHPGKVYFTFEDGDGRPSRWNTLRALRVLDWYEPAA